MKIFNKNINLNKFANIALVLAILLFALSLLTNVIVRSRKNSTNLKISETQKENTLSPENNEEKQQPLIIEETKIINNSGESLDFVEEQQ